MRSEYVINIFYDEIAVFEKAKQGQIHDHRYDQCKLSKCLTVACLINDQTCKIIDHCRCDQYKYIDWFAPCVEEQSADQDEQVP